MKRVFLLACLIAVVAGEATAQPAGAPRKAPIKQEQTERWQRYTVRGEDFSVTLPILPAMSTRMDFDQRLGKDRRRRTLGAYADGLVFSVSCIQNPQPRQLLDDFIEEEFMARSGWDRTSETELKRNGFSGKQYVSTTNIGGTLQVFATAGNFYRFEVFGAKADDPRVKQYFSSILLGPRRPGVAVSDGVGAVVKATDTTRPLLAKDVDRRVVLVMRPQPAYTDAARENGVTGPVLLKAIFFSNGTVDEVQVLSSLPDGLTERAVEAAKKIKFIPAIKNGKFVSVFMQIEYHFDLY